MPWRKLGIWTAVTAVALGAAAAIAVPKIDAAKKEGDAQRAADSLALDNIERARLRDDQRVHRAQVPAGAALVASLERAITADAKERAAAKTISGPVLSTSCEIAGPSATQFPDSRVYKCFVKTATGLRGKGADVLGTGYPFVATIYEKERLVAWCKQNPHADEKGSKGDLRVTLSPICAGHLTNVL